MVWIVSGLTGHQIIAGILSNPFRSPRFYWKQKVFSDVTMVWFLFEIGPSEFSDHHDSCNMRWFVAICFGGSRLEVKKGTLVSSICRFCICGLSKCIIMCCVWFLVGEDCDWVWSWLCPWGVCGFCGCMEGNDGMDVHIVEGGFETLPSPTDCSFIQNPNQFFLALRLLPYSASCSEKDLLRCSTIPHLKHISSILSYFIVTHATNSSKRLLWKPGHKNLVMWRLTLILKKFGYPICPSCVRSTSTNSSTRFTIAIAFCLLTWFGARWWA